MILRSFSPPDSSVPSGNIIRAVMPLLCACKSQYSNLTKAFTKKTSHHCTNLEFHSDVVRAVAVYGINRNESIAVRRDHVTFLFEL